MLTRFKAYTQVQFHSIRIRFTITICTRIPFCKQRLTKFINSRICAPRASVRWAWRRPAGPRATACLRAPIGPVPRRASRRHCASGRRGPRPSGRSALLLRAPQALPLGAPPCVGRAAAPSHAAYALRLRVPRVAAPSGPALPRASVRRSGPPPHRAGTVPTCTARSTGPRLAARNTGCRPDALPRVPPCRAAGRRSLLIPSHLHTKRKRR
jgi:hypothetical protein